LDVIVPLSNEIHSSISAVEGIFALYHGGGWDAGKVIECLSKNSKK